MNPPATTTANAIKTAAPNSSRRDNEA